ncbi:MAG: type II toxin-antitoxin system ParD family antitoxin [Bacteroidia bacterium]|jgi:antitoxin ParD1/3/4|tara:strand:+ start:750 stop:1007 length:258 start_codon:yes stop_codon:yes gene_type:complete
MANIRKSITFTEPLNNWVQSLISSGEYTNESEYIRDLIRRDRKENSEVQQLRIAIQEGVDSGLSTKSLKDIFAEKKKQMEIDGSL